MMEKDDKFEDSPTIIANKEAMQDEDKKTEL